MKRYQEIGLFLLLVITASPIAFLLMPIIAAGFIIVGAKTLFSNLIRR